MAGVNEDTTALMSSPNVEQEGLAADISPDSESYASARPVFLEMLDQVEKHVEKLRLDALKLEEERDILLTTLDTMKNNKQLAQLSDVEKEEVISFADRLIGRCLTVEIIINTPRDKIQEDALYQVNTCIDKLVVNMHEDPQGTKVKCVTYINSCLYNQSGNIDSHFEEALLACAADDQKWVRRRLQGLLHYFQEGQKETDISSVYN